MILKLYLIALPVFFAIDLVWLGFIAKSVYQKYIGALLAPSVNWPAAISFYLLFILGMVVFAVHPAMEKGSWQHLIIYGAFFGFITYMTYDLTNLATLKDWPWQIVVIDIIWGTVLSLSVSAVTYYLAVNVFKI